MELPLLGELGDDVQQTVLVVVVGLLVAFLYMQHQTAAIRAQATNFPGAKSD